MNAALYHAYFFRFQFVCPFELTESKVNDQLISYGIDEMNAEDTIKDVYTICESCGAQPVAITDEAKNYSVVNFLKNNCE